MTDYLEEKLDYNKKYNMNEVRDLTDIPYDPSKIGTICATINRFDKLSVLNEDGELECQYERNENDNRSLTGLGVLLFLKHEVEKNRQSDQKELMYMAIVRLDVEERILNDLKYKKRKLKVEEDKITLSKVIELMSDKLASLDSTIILNERTLDLLTNKVFQIRAMHREEGHWSRSRVEGFINEPYFKPTIEDHLRKIGSGAS